MSNNGKYSMLPPTGRGSNDFRHQIKRQDMANMVSGGGKPPRFQ